MKRIVRWLSVLSIIVGCLGWLGNVQSAMAANFGAMGAWMQPTTVLAAEAGELRNTVSDKLATEFGKKLDLNNTNVRYFRDLPGMYPKLAGIIVKNAPYAQVNDVLNIPGLTNEQKSVIEGYLDKFTVTDPDSALVEGNDRINNGIYR
ncbi:photosystem II complex extrinsic protein PsbU [Alkalinema sp. FACHB-956]|uniref:photosystem II complex extrinsic protein PsbU n=1 Tax=Alkalinema sp. FACHB-956 TaxID=2692768 RepID=UPI00168884B0|nr:photosystem II complex extrinsic protein PsbU [Alkalinema sp. FACHB-956]MBD2327375.1 photosystem II complex extrinsic protein PsbU [Alkalinema sp. FACHB-956]